MYINMQVSYVHKLFNEQDDYENEISYNFYPEENHTFSSFPNPMKQKQKQ